MEKLKFEYDETFKVNVAYQVNLIVYSNKNQVLYVMGNDWFATKPLDWFGKQAGLISIFFLLGRYKEYMLQGNDFANEVEVIKV